jgi:hypothetical protein
MKSLIVCLCIFCLASPAWATHFYSTVCADNAQEQKDLKSMYPDFPLCAYTEIGVSEYEEVASIYSTVPECRTMIKAAFQWTGKIVGQDYQDIIKCKTDASNRRWAQQIKTAITHAKETLRKVMRETDK